MKDLLNRIRGFRPVMLTQAELDRSLDEAAQDARMEEARWNVQSGRQVPSRSNPFAALSGLDSAAVYQGGELYRFPDLDSPSMQRLDASRKGKVMEAFKQILEFTTAGWVTIGGNRGILAARDLAPEQLWLAQDAAVLKSKTDPHAQGIIRNLQFYTVGTGVSWSTPSKEVNEWLEKFRRENRMDQRERAQVKEMFQEGEYFTVFFVDPASGRVKVRKHRPKEVVEIETADEDMETRLAYKRMIKPEVSSDAFQWVPDIHYLDQLDDPLSDYRSQHELADGIFMQFSRYGDSDELRGWPPMYAALRWLKYYEDFIVDRARLHHERAKVVWFMTRKGQVNRKRKNDSSNPTPHLAPKGGTMWIEDDSVSYRAESLQLDSADASEDALLLLYAISSAVTQPLHVWNQRADQAVYSSLRKADTPFSQGINFNQAFLDEEWTIRDRFVLAQAIKANKLPDRVTITRHDEDLVLKAIQRVNEMVVDGKDEEWILGEAKTILAPGIKKEAVPTLEVPIDRTFPDVVQESPLELAKVLLIHQKMGIVSDATLARRSGYDWTRELVGMFREAEGKRKLNELRSPIQPAPGQQPPGQPPKGGPGREPGSGAGSTKASKDDLSVGGDPPEDKDG